MSFDPSNPDLPGAPDLPEFPEALDNFSADEQLDNLLEGVEEGLAELGEKLNIVESEQDTLGDQWTMNQVRHRANEARLSLAEMPSPEDEGRISQELAYAYEPQLEFARQDLERSALAALKIPFSPTQSLEDWNQKNLRLQEHFRQPGAIEQAYSEVIEIETRSTSLEFDRELWCHNLGRELNAAGPPLVDPEELRSVYDHFVTHTDRISILTELEHRQMMLKHDPTGELRRRLDAIDAIEDPDLKAAQMDVLLLELRANG